MIDVEERPLRTFKKNLFPALQRPVQVHDCVCDERPQLFACFEIRLIDFAEIDRSGAEGLQDAIVLPNLCLKFLREETRLHQIGNPQASRAALSP